MKNPQAFTLAEIMIVLVVIGVLASILLPVAIHSAPDENVMKFKKGNNTLGVVIRELVNSDRYYLNGNLGIKADGTRILSSFSNGGGETTSDESLIKYFCTTVADVLSTKKVDCKTTVTGGNDRFTFVAIPSKIDYTWQSTMEEAKELFDTNCAEVASKVGAEIETSDGIYWYQVNPAATFGIHWNAFDSFLFNGFDDTNKNLDYYKIFCMDVDGINKGEAPFGYGIRIDGKILTGARADEWIEKSVQKGD